MNKFLVSLGLVCFSVGCTSLVSTVGPKDHVDALKGFVYGQFYQENEIPTRMSLVIMNTVTKKTDKIKLDNQSAFGAAEKYSVCSILPGTYVVSSVTINYFETVGNMQYSYNNVKPFTDPVFSQPFAVKAGEKVYLGDFIAKTARNQSRIFWEVKAGSTFAATTKEINEKYTNIAAIPTREAFPSKK